MNETNQHWAAIWGNAVSIAEHRPESYSRNITLRYPIDVPFDGEALRITLDNYCGPEAVTVTRATVAVADPGFASYKDLTCPVLAERIVDLTFGGKANAELPPHGRLVSDAVAFPVSAGSTVCVSLYFETFTLMQSAVLITGALSKGFFSFGDQTHSSALPLFETKTTNMFYFLSNVDVLTDAKNRALICYGDSITAQDWPDELKLRLRKLGCHNTAVIRRAASGTRILREYSCITYDSYGLKGTNRFHHEIPTAGADTLIIQQGINDIIHPVGAEVNVFRPMSDLPTVQELADGLLWYIAQAKEMGLKVYLGTLLPIFGWRTYAPFREDMRCQLNDWMRTCKEADGCIDFDLAVRDPKKPEAFAPGFDSGDHLHPSKLAYACMAEAVPEFLLK